MVAVVVVVVMVMVMVVGVGLPFLPSPGFQRVVTDRQPREGGGAVGGQVPVGQERFGVGGQVGASPRGHRLNHGTPVALLFVLESGPLDPRHAF